MNNASFVKAQSVLLFAFFGSAGASMGAFGASLGLLTPPLWCLNAIRWLHNGPETPFEALLMSPNVVVYATWWSQTSTILAIFAVATGLATIVLARLFHPRFKEFS